MFLILFFKRTFNFALLIGITRYFLLIFLHLLLRVKNLSRRGKEFLMIIEFLKNEFFQISSTGFIKKMVFGAGDFSLSELICCNPKDI